MGDLRLFHAAWTEVERQNWHLKIDPWIRRLLVESMIFRIHMSFQGCNAMGWRGACVSFPPRIKIIFSKTGRSGTGDPRKNPAIQTQSNPFFFGGSND